MTPNLDGGLRPTTIPTREDMLTRTGVHRNPDPVGSEAVPSGASLIGRPDPAVMEDPSPPELTPVAADVLPGTADIHMGFDNAEFEWGWDHEEPEVSSLALLSDSLGDAAPQPRTGWLARRLGLTVYGDSLMTGRAATDLASRGMMLVLNLVFDLVVWTAFANTILHQGELRFGLLTVAAFALACIPSFAIFIYERGVITTDASVRKGKFRVAVFLRVLVIVAMALVTARTVELLYFSQAIDRRLHAEAVYSEARLRLHDLRKADKLRLDASRFDATREVMSSGLVEQIDAVEKEESMAVATEIEANQLASEKRAEAAEIETRLAELPKAIDTARDKRVRAARRRNSAAREYKPLKKAHGKEWVKAERPKLYRRMAQAQTRLKTADQALAALEAEAAELPALRGEALRAAAAEGGRATAAHRRVESLKRQLKELGERRTLLLEKAGRHEDYLEAESKALPTRIQQWLTRIQATPPLETVGETHHGPDPAWLFSPPPVDVTERSRVLDDLKHARPPLWDPTGLSTSTAEVLEAPENRVEDEAVEPTNDGVASAPEAGAVHGRSDMEMLVSLLGFDPGAPRSSVEQRRAGQRAEILRWEGWLVHGFAMLLPFLIIMLKFTSSADLATYYNRRAQALSGNIDARAQTNAEQLS